MNLQIRMSGTGVLTQGVFMDGKIPTRNLRLGTVYKSNPSLRYEKGVCIRLSYEMGAIN